MNVVSRSAIASAVGNTAIWSPAAGRRFRMMGYSWTYSGINANNILVSLRDGATLIAYVVAIPAAPSTIVQSGSYTLPGDGYISAADNTVLNINLDAISAGIAFTVWGVEE